MKITPLMIRENQETDSKLTGTVSYFNSIINELNRKDLPESTVKEINGHIEELNSFKVHDGKWRKMISKKLREITRLLEKKHHIVTKNFYRTLWMVLGMSAFGLPLGLIYGLSMGNLGLIGIGLPIGMAMGIVLGTKMDKKAQKEGRQLDVEVKIRL